MLEKQKQVVGDNSTAIQVNGNMVVTPYQEVRAIFLDLFELNFPKIQEIAAKIAQDRLEQMFAVLRTSLEKHQSDIDPSKFTEPAIQYEMQGIAIDVARRGDKSNMEMLCELFCIIASKDCPELIELVATETRRILPMLSKKHLAYLSLKVLVNEVEIPETQSLAINDFLCDINRHIAATNDLTNGDFEYLVSVGCISRRGVGHIGIVPNFIKNIDEHKNIKHDQLSNYCLNNKLENISKFLDLMKICRIGTYHLSATGRLIGWLNLRKYSNVKLEELF